MRIVPRARLTGAFGGAMIGVPIVGLAIIFASEVLWIVMSTDDAESAP